MKLFYRKDSNSVDFVFYGPHVKYNFRHWKRPEAVLSDTKWNRNKL